MFKKLTIQEIAAITLCLIRNNESMYQVRRGFEILLRDSKSPKFTFKTGWKQMYFFCTIDRKIKQHILEILLESCLTSEPLKTTDESILLHTTSERIQARTGQ